MGSHFGLNLEDVIAVVVVVADRHVFLTIIL